MVRNVHDRGLSLKRGRLAHSRGAPALPAIGVIPRILLLCARLELTDAQAEALRRLCAKVEDWNALLREAEFRLIVPLVHRHLAHAGEGGGAVDSVPTAVLQALRERAYRVALQNLRFHATQRKLVREIFEPLGVPYLFLKGLSLAERYYPDPNLRMVRDVDVLIAKDTMASVAGALMEAGFESDLIGSSWSWTAGAVAFVNRFMPNMNWVSPEKVLVEIKSDLDPPLGRFNTEVLLREWDVVDTAGGPLRVVPTTTLFLYMAYHHTKHLWARLHWVADVDAILRDPSFDHAVVRAEAANRNLCGLVSAALAVHAAAGEPDPSQVEAHLGDPYAREVFRHCLLNLQGDRTTELALRRAFPVWQTNLSRRQQFVYRVLSMNVRKFHPLPKDYAYLPLPPKLLGLYYPLRLIRGLVKNLRR